MNYVETNSPLFGRRLLALLATPLVLSTFVPAAATPATSQPAPSQVEVPAGQMAFEAQKCNLCHAVSNHGIERRTKSEKMQARDLAGLGEDFDRTSVEKYLRQEESLEGEKHKKPFKGTDEELQAILDWLATL